MAGGSGGGSSSQTVTSSQQIPQFEQQFAQNNQDIAASLAAQPYPAYHGPLVQEFSPQQLQGMQMAGQAATSYQPYLNNASAYVNQGAQGGFNALQGAMQQGGAAVAANNPANAGVIGQYMSPYVAQALQPQITTLQNQLGQQQNQIAAQATGANAFGDARQGVEQAAQNFYGNQALSGLLGQGYNAAYGNALQTALQEQQTGIGEQQALGQLGQAYGNLGLQTGQQMANLGAQQQGLGIAGANALYGAGQQQQILGQQELNAAYQQFQNQSLWPYQGLNVRESALSNSPYNIVNQTTLPNANMTAQNLGMFASLAGLLGGGASANAYAPFGGQPYNSAMAHV